MANPCFDSYGLIFLDAYLEILMMKRFVSKLFMKAVRAGELSTVRWLRPFIDMSFSEDGTPALVWAASHGDVNMVRELLKSPGVALIADHRGATAMMWAACRGHPEVVDLLLLVSDPKAQDIEGNTALMEAAANGYHELVEVLLPVSDPLAVDANGNTALMKAVEQGYRFVIEPLLRVSDLHAVNKAGFNALALAMLHKKIRAYELLEQERVRREQLELDQWLSHKRELSTTEIKPMNTRRL